MLPGCVHYQESPLAPPASAAAFAARRLDDPRLRLELQRVLARDLRNWPLDRWDRDELLAAALLRNPELATVQAQIDQALAHELAAARPTNPGVTLQSEYARQEARPWLYGIGLDLPLRPTERSVAQRLARIESANSRWHYLEQTWAVRRDLTEALSGWEGVRRRLDLLDRLAADQERLQELEQRRIAAGEDAPAAIVPVETARLDIEQQHVQALIDLSTAQAAAARALGVAPAAVQGLSLNWPDWGEPPPLDASDGRERERALLSRSDLAEAIGEYGLAETELKLAVSRQYPRIDVEPGYYWDHGIAKWPFDLGFTLPIDGNRGEIAEARAARELAGRRMLALQADIIGQISAAERAEGRLRDAAAVAELELQAARRDVAHHALALRLGDTGLEESLAADIVAIRAELELLRTRGQLQRARNQLEDALHMPLSGPELSLLRAARPPVPGS